MTDVRAGVDRRVLDRGVGAIIRPTQARERLLAGHIERASGYAHVLVDEAQDLSPMQWRLVGRRGRSASWTVVGDAAQASWVDAAEAARARQEVFAGMEHRSFHKTTNYRNACEIFDYARAQQGAVSSVAGQGAIIAPASGRVLRADIPQGSAVAPGVSVATITAGEPIVRLDLPESLIGKVRVGARIALADPDMPSGSLIGQVVQVYPAIAGGRVRLDATVSGLATTSVGRRVNATVEVGQRNAIVVPRKFVSTRYGMDYVDVVAKDGALSSVPVQLAPTADSGMVEILSGVGEGDTLYTAGAPTF